MKAPFARRFTLFLIRFCLLLSVQPCAAQDGFIKGTPALAYWTNADTGQVIIVLHGGPAAGSAYLRPEWDHLAAYGRVVYYDQRGSGKSEAGTCYSWKEHIADLKRVISQLAAGKKVVLAGSSWGSFLALLYAITYPTDVKALVLSGTVPWRGLGQLPRSCSDYNELALQYSAIDTALVLVSLESRKIIKPYTADSATLRRFKESRYFEAPYLPRVATNLSMSEAPKIDTLASLTVPVLVIEGKWNCLGSDVLRDAALDYKRVLPYAQVFTIAEACHDPWYSHPAVFFKACGDFLSHL